MEYVMTIILIIMEIILARMCWILIHNKYSFGKIISTLISIMLLLNLNSIVGITSYYIKGEDFNIIHINIIFMIYNLLLYILLRKNKFFNSRINSVNKVTKSEKYFLIIFSCIFAILFLSTQCSFMPIWGNVDEANHYYFINTFHQRLFINSKFNDIFVALNPKNSQLYAMEIFRYSYLFGYHFICAIISKITFIDTIYILHFSLCIIMASYLAAPILLCGNRKKIIILYIILLVLGSDKWYSMIATGYDAQLYAIMLCMVLLVFIAEVLRLEEENKFVWYFIIPINVLGVLNAYSLVGGILISWLILILIIKRKFKALGINIIYLLFLIPIPAISNQIKNLFFSENVVLDEALTVKYNEVPIIIIIISIYIIFAITNYIIRNKIKDNYKECFYLVTMVWIIITYFILGKDNYTSYKTYIMSFPIILLACIESSYLYITNKRFRQEGIFILVSIVLVLTNILSLNITNLKNIVNAKPMIEKGEYSCIKYLINNYEDDTNVEYINTDGPTNFLMYSLVRKYSITSQIEEESRNMFFKDTRNYSDLYNYISDDIKGFELENGKVFLTLSNKNNKRNYISNKKYEYLIENNEVLYSKDDWQVKKYTLNTNIDQQNIGLQEWDNITDSEKTAIEDIHMYEKCLVSKAGNQEIILDKYINSITDKNIYMKIDGRCINGADVKIQLLNYDNIVAEEDLPEFQHVYNLEFKDISNINRIKVIFNPKDIYDSVLIQKISIMY